MHFALRFVNIWAPQNPATPIVCVLFLLAWALLNAGIMAGRHDFSMRPPAERNSAKEVMK
jgi:hypothetical protein